MVHLLGSAGWQLDFAISLGFSGAPKKPGKLRQEPADPRKFSSRLFRLLVWRAGHALRALKHIAVERETTGRPTAPSALPQAPDKLAASSAL